MTSDQRSFVSKAGLPIALYSVGLAGVCVISAIWGITSHPFFIDLVALGFTYLLVLSVFFGVVRGVSEADDAPATRPAIEEPPHGVREAA